MTLELHDSEVGNSLVRRIQHIEYDYQAEQCVQDTYNDQNATEVVKWILLDAQDRTLCVWERPVGDTSLPTITSRSSRFQGEWERGPNETVID